MTKIRNPQIRTLILISLLVIPQLFVQKNRNNSDEEMWVRVFQDTCFEDLIEVEGGYVLAGPSSNGAFLLRTDDQGIAMWNESYLGPPHIIVWGEGGHVYHSDMRQVSIVNCPDGGFAFCGHYCPYWVHKSMSWRGGYPAYGIWVIHTDDNGHHLWNKTFHREKTYQLEERSYVSYSILECGSSGFLLAGWTRENKDYFVELCLLRIDINGNHIWNKTYGINDYYSIHNIDPEQRDWSLVKLMSDSYVAAGIRYIEQFELFMICVDESGNCLWNRTFSGIRGYGRVVACPEGGFALLHDLAYPYGVALVRMDDNSNVIWNRTYLTPSRSWRDKLVACSDGGFLIVLNLEEDISAIRTTANGETSWLRQIDIVRTLHPNTHFMSGDMVESAIECNDSGFVITGYTSSKLESGGFLMWLSDNSLPTTDSANSTLSTEAGNIPIATLIQNGLVLVVLVIIIIAVLKKGSRRK